jgi:hypothetical protein
LSATENKAWAEFKTPFSKSILIDFCRDIEQLFRINPYVEIINWEKLNSNDYSIELINHSQEPAFVLKTDMHVLETSNGLIINYVSGIKTNTQIQIEEIPEGSKLTITDHYSLKKTGLQQDDLKKVDKSLTKWAEEIQIFLIQWKHWAWLLPWKYYKQYIWIRMKPSARRVSYMLIIISLIEICLIGLGTIIYFLEFR